MSKLINISELSKMLNLIDSKTKKPANHVLRYWEAWQARIFRIKLKALKILAGLSNSKV